MSNKKVIELKPDKDGVYRALDHNEDLVCQTDDINMGIDEFFDSYDQVFSVIRKIVKRVEGYYEKEED